MRIRESDLYFQPETVFQVITARRLFVETLMHFCCLKEEEDSVVSLRMKLFAES